MITIDDQKVFENHRRAAESMSADEVTDRDVPEFIAIEVKSGHEDLTWGDVSFATDIGGRNFMAVNGQKRNIDRLAISCWSSGSVAVQLVFGLQL